MTAGGVTTGFLLDRQNAVQEIQNGSPVATYLVGPRGMEYRQDASGQRRWYIYDGLGSVIAEVDQDGKVNPDQQGNETPLRKYDVYGAIRNSQEVAPGTSSHKFVGSLGHTSENESGLIYMRARYYDPAIGRFISEDPGRNGANWYAYCNNNPVNLADQDGKMPLWLDAALFLIGQILSPPFAYLALAAIGAILYASTVPIGMLGEAIGIEKAGNAALAGGAMAQIGWLRGVARMSVATTSWGTTITTITGFAGVLNLIGIVATSLAMMDLLNRALNGDGVFE